MTGKIRPEGVSTSISTHTGSAGAACPAIAADDELRQRMRSFGLRNPEAFIAYKKAKEQFDKAHAMALDEMSQGLLEASTLPLTMWI